ncbi:MAG: hypothetical protein AAF634_05055 [Bacteroidota bacterium]
MLKIEISITSMSTEYFIVLSKAMDAYGTFLLEQSEKNKMGNERKDHSILTQAFFKVEPKISQRKLLEPTLSRDRKNKSLKIGVHSGMVILDAISAYWPLKSFSETPALEHVKDQISKQLL